MHKRKNNSSFNCCFIVDTGKRKMEESPNREPEAKLVKTGSENEYLSDLIVLGLPYKANEDDVKDYFQQFGDLAMHEVFIALFLNFSCSHNCYHLYEGKLFGLFEFDFEIGKKKTFLNKLLTF